MALFSVTGWLKAMSRKSGARRRDPRRGQRPPGRRSVPRLESLEQRLAPAIFTVNTLTDSGPGSLRNMIAQAGNNDTIQIDPSLKGTITLTGGVLSPNRNVTITGPGAANLTISGNNTDRVFLIGGGTTVTLSGLTVTGGSS